MSRRPARGRSFARRVSAHRMGAVDCSSRSSARRAASCPARSASKDGLVGVAPEERELGRGERGAEDGDGLADPVLVRHDAVDVALDQEGAPGLGHPLARAVEAVERLPLLVERRLGGVQVLWLLAGERAASEGDHAPLRVRDREDEPAAEAVVVAGGVLAREDQPSAEERLDRMAVPAGRAEQMVPALGRPAQAEGPRRLAAEAASVEVRAGALRVRAIPEPAFEAARGPLHEREEPVAGAGSGVDSRPGKGRPPGRPGGAPPRGSRDDRAAGELEALPPRGSRSSGTGGASGER